MADLTPEQIAAQEAAQKEAELKAAEEAKLEEKKQMRNEIMRDMSKEYGFNLFDADGLNQFKEYQENQKTDLEKAQEVIKGFNEEKAQWEKEKLKYETKIKASELGINSKYMEDALKLADNDPDKLAEVVEKFPMFKGGDKIVIGKQDPKQTPPPNDKSEAIAYMSQNPRYRGYLNNKK